jgi:hypothetical protein
MIGDPVVYLDWVLNDNNGYLLSQDLTQWEELVVASGLQASRDALENALASRLHLPEVIPDALHQDPELDLGAYRMHALLLRWTNIPSLATTQSTSTLSNGLAGS